MTSEHTKAVEREQNPEPDELRAFQLWRFQMTLDPPIALSDRSLQQAYQAGCARERDRIAPVILAAKGVGNSAQIFDGKHRAWHWEHVLEAARKLDHELEDVGLTRDDTEEGL